MNVHAYARVKDELEREAFRKGVYSTIGVQDRTTFRFDVLAGKSGLTSTLAAASQDENVMIVFAYVSDAGRDLRECVFNLSELMLTPGVKEIRILNDNIKLTCAEYGEAWKLIQALAGAHGHYGRLNRRLAVRHAWALGVRKGREPVATLNGVRDAIHRLMDANDGHLPSVRKFAAEIGVSRGKAHNLLREFKQEGKRVAA